MLVGPGHGVEDSRWVTVGAEAWPGAGLSQSRCPASRRVTETAGVPVTGDGHGAGEIDSDRLLVFTGPVKVIRTPLRLNHHDRVGPAGPARFPSNSTVTVTGP
jgi:hypothetical protein